MNRKPRLQEPIYREMNPHFLNYKSHLYMYMHMHIYVYMNDYNIRLYPFYELSQF